MTVRLNPYLLFPGTARKAMQTYQSALGGELEVMTFGQSGMPAEQYPADGVMHAMLTTDDGFVLMASDGPDAEIRPGAGSPISLSGDDEARLRGWWDALSEGGTVDQPLLAAPWGDVFGTCTDRFGTTWMVNITGAGAPSVQPEG